MLIAAESKADYVSAVSENCQLCDSRQGLTVSTASGRQRKTAASRLTPVSTLGALKDTHYWERVWYSV